MQSGNTITVHCTGSVAVGDDRTKFWSTRDPGQDTFTFKIGEGNVIKCWDEGCLGMKVGERAKLLGTSDVCYGARGFPAWGIPANADLEFDIEIISIA